MNFKQFVEYVNLSSVPVMVKFKKSIEDLESFASEGMIAQVINAASSLGVNTGNVYDINFDFSVQAELNKGLQGHDFYINHGDGKSTLGTAIEAHMITPNLIDNMYWYDEDNQMENTDKYFEILDQNAVYQAYSSSGTSLGYLAWMEDRVLKGLLCQS